MAWFDCAVRMPIYANTGGITSAYNGLVLHHAVSNASELQSLFGRPGFGASAHFYVRQDGQIQQMVDTGVVAWAQGNSTGNATMTSVETQGCATPPYADPMSSAMMDGLARLYAEGHARHGWPLQLADTQGARGFSYHRLWNATACPCDVRVNARAEILRRAGGVTPSPPPLEEDGGTMIASTPGGKGYWTTTRNDGAVYAFGDAQFHGGVNTAGPGGKSALPAGRTIVGIAGDGNSGYWILSSGGDVYAFGSARFMGKPDRA